MPNKLSEADYIGFGKTIHAEQRVVTEHCKLHRHEFFELELILEGLGTQRLNGMECKLVPGTVTCMKPIDFHEIKVREPLVVCNISFSFSALDNRFSHLMLQQTGQTFRPDEPLFHRFRHLGALLSDAVQTNQDTEYTGHLLFCLLLLLPCSSAEENRRQNKAIQTALTYLQMHFHENPSLDQIATNVHLSRKYLSELFHKETGQTISRFLSDLKLQYAAQLLTTTELSITDVCFACGYTSIPNFFKSFKKKFALSPLQYRMSKH